MIKKEYRIMISILTALTEEFEDIIKLNSISATVKDKEEIKRSISFLREHFSFLREAAVTSSEYQDIRSQVLTVLFTKS